MEVAGDNNVERVWEGVIEGVRRSLPASAFELWIEPLRPLTAAGDEVIVVAPRRLRSWVERRYLGLLEERLRALGGDYQRITLTDSPAAPGSGRVDGQGSPVSLEPDPRHDFDRFVIGPGNRLAHAAALAVAEAPGEAYNPLFLHGPPGLGKTHLMGAITSYLQRRRPGMSVHLTTAERFTNEFVAALRADGPERFKRRYRELDALLIDDVQVLEGKARTEEEFVHTFNTLFAAGKQIVISSDRPPGALARLETRLRDRFDWGLTVPIEPPDLGTRTAVLLRLAPDSLAETSEMAAIRHLAHRVHGNVRLLEGALTRVLAHSSLLGRALDGELIDQAVDLRPEPAGLDAGGIGIDAVVEAVASSSGVSRDEILSSRRTPVVARARQLAMYVARERTTHSLAEIARAFKRDHSTVLHAIRVVEERRRDETSGAELEQAIQTIHNRLPDGVD